MLDISHRLFHNWNEKGVRYCHWKSNEHLMAGLEGDTDLDVLVSERDGDVCREIMRSLSFLECRSQYGSRYPGVEDWIGFDEETGGLIHIHLHFALITGKKGLKEYRLPWAEEMLDTRVLDDATGVFVADPSLEIMTLFTRIALKGMCWISASVLSEIAYLHLHVDWERVSDWTRQFFGKYASDVLTIIQSEKPNKEELTAMRSIAAKQFRKCNRYGCWSRILVIYYRKAIRFRKLLRTRFQIYLVNRKVPRTEKGLRVAFLGQDGAGKTTVTKDIRKWWTWKMDAQLVYLGSGDNYSSWRKTLQRIIPASRLFKPVRAWLQLSKYAALAKDTLKRIRKGGIFARKGGLVIFDRYPQVAFPGICDGPKIRSGLLSQMPTGFSRLFTGYARREELLLKQASDIEPDLVFKLVIPPEESVRRKPENRLEDMVRKHEIILALPYGDAEVYTIDATKPYEAEVLQIKQIIWDHFIQHA